MGTLYTQTPRSSEIYPPPTFHCNRDGQAPIVSPKLCRDTFFVTGKGPQIIPIGVIYDSIGREACNALPGLHALSGADITGSFSGKGKKTWWKAFQGAGSEILSALARLGYSETLEEDIFQKIEEFV